MQSFPEYFWCLRFILFYVEEVLVQQLGCTQKYIKKREKHNTCTTPVFLHGGVWSL